VKDGDANENNDDDDDNKNNNNSINLLERLPKLVVLTSKLFKF
jgi:hypothetical protein